MRVACPTTSFITSATQCWTDWQGWAEIRESVVSGRRSRIEAANEIWRLAPEPWYQEVACDVGTQLLGVWNHDK